METVLVIGLLAFVGFREYLAHKERSELVDRLMSKDLKEFKSESKPEPNQLEPAKDTTVPLGVDPDDVPDDIREELENG